MADSVSVKLNLVLIAKNIRVAEDHEVSDDDLLAFLAEAGFARRDDGRWGCEEISLNALGTGEYSDVRPVG